MKKKIFAIVICLVMVFSVLAGCGSSDSDSGTSSDSGTRTVTDTAGREVEIPDTVEKTASGWPAGDAIIIMLGQKDTLATINSYNTQGNNMIPELFPELMDLPVTPDTTEETVEEYLAQGVQVVFTSESAAEEFENAGIAALVIDTSSTEGMIDTILMMGEAFGGDSLTKAQEYVDYFNDNMETTTAVTDELSDDERPRVYYAAGGLLSTEGEGSITNDWIGAGGGVNVATENGIEGSFVEIDAETLLDWDPDIIMLRDAEYYDELYSDSVLDQLTAVKNDQVYVVPNGIYNWAVRASEAAIMPLWAAVTISPDLFPDIDIEQETLDYHNTFYGLDLTDDQVSAILYRAGA